VLRDSGVVRFHPPHVHLELGLLIRVAVG